MGKSYNKYYNLRKEVSIINKKIVELKEIHKKLNFEIEQCILIDDKILEKVTFDNIKSSYISIQDEISEIIIPEINNKL